MNIEELRKEKSDTEQKIMGLLQEFQERTGLKVLGVDVEVFELTTHDDSRCVAISQVNLEVRL